jgi:hypothetical protein
MSYLIYIAFEVKLNDEAFFFSFPVSGGADGAVHNLNEYNEICAADVMTNAGSDLINVVFTQKLGVVANEGQLEDFFSQIP